MSHVIKFTKKICSALENAGYSMVKFSKIELAYPELCSVNVTMQKDPGLYSGLTTRRLSSCVKFSGLTGVLFL